MVNKEKNFISAVVYVHNAEDRIDKFLKAIITVLEENFEHSELICVNDCSEDASIDVIRNLAEYTDATSISVINMSHFSGLEAAMNTGRDLAIGDFVLEFDNTILDFETEEIIKIYHRALQGYDIVSASPDRKQRASSNLFYFVFDRFTKLKYEMNTESFRILSRRVINRIVGMNKTVPYRKAVYANCGLKTDNLLYRVQGGLHGRIDDKQERKYRSLLAVDTLILFTELGYSFAKNMTLLMMLVTVAMALYSFVVYVIGNPVAGWTTTMIFLAFSFFGLFGILTIVIKYLQIIVDLIFKTKRYTYESIEKLTK